MKRLGLIGGVGPESTIEYYRMILASYREKNDDVRHRPLRHELSKYEHTGQGQTAADQGQHGHKLLIEAKHVDHPPAGPGTRSRQGPKTTSVRMASPQPE